MTMTTQTIALRLAPEVRHKLELLAEATGYSRSTLVAEAVRRFVDEELSLLLTAQDPDQPPAGAALQAEPEPDDHPAHPGKDSWKIIV